MSIRDDALVVMGWACLVGGVLVLTAASTCVGLALAHALNLGVVGNPLVQVAMGAALIGVGAIAVTAGHRGRTLRFPLGDCQRCGYHGALRDGSVRCPECGWPTGRGEDG